MTDHPLPYRIERTSNRTSRAVLRDDAIVIRLAKGLSTAQEREHIESLLRRMVGYLERDRRRESIDPFRALLDGAESALVTLGSGRSLFVELVPAPRTRAHRTERGWRIAVGPNVRRRSLHRYLWNLLAAEEYVRISRLVHGINAATFRSPLRSVRLRFLTSQWGSCSAQSDITLSAVLLFVPEDLLRYVIVHELAHTLHRHHGVRFWRAVEGVLPDCGEARKRLRNYRASSL